VAWEGVLPTGSRERGVTYAEADTTEAAWRGGEGGRVADDQFEGLRRELLGLEVDGRKTMSSIGDVDERERRVMELLAEATRDAGSRVARHLARDRARLALRVIHEHGDPAAARVRQHMTRCAAPARA